MISMSKSLRLGAGGALLAALGISAANATDPLLHVSLCNLGSSYYGATLGTAAGMCSIEGGPGGLGGDPNNFTRYKVSSIPCYSLTDDDVEPCDPYICCSDSAYFASVPVILPKTCEVTFFCVGKRCDANGAHVVPLPPPPGCALSMSPAVLKCRNSGS